MPPKKKEIPRRKSNAKKLLQDDIKNRVVTDTMKARDVYNMRHEYQEYRYDRFHANLRALHKLFELRETEAVEDQADFSMIVSFIQDPSSRVEDALIGTLLWLVNFYCRILRMVCTRFIYHPSYGKRAMNIKSFR